VDDSEAILAATEEASSAPAKDVCSQPSNNVRVKVSRCDLFYQQGAVNTVKSLADVNCNSCGASCWLAPVKPVNNSGRKGKQSHGTRAEGGKAMLGARAG
jgi:hypothetical protein